MGIELEYASPVKAEGLGRKVIAAGLMGVAVLIYAILCDPAMHRRGYPPIDHIWMGMTYLWVFAVPVFVLYISAGRYSRVVLLLYALATGFVDSCTVVMMVPHRFDLVESLFGTIFMGPLHVFVVVILFWICRCVYWLLGLTKRELESWSGRVTAGRVVVALGILVLAFLFPSIYKKGALAADDRKGRELADADWMAHEARMKGEEGEARHQVGDVTITSEFDPVTGLKLEFERQHGYEAAYKARVAELLRIHGVPSWSMKNRLVDDADVIEMFHHEGMTEVKTFPFAVTPNVVLMRAGTLARWGYTMTSTGPGLTINTAHGGTYGFGEDLAPAYVGRLSKYAGVVFIRGGDKWVAAFTDDGTLLQSAEKR